MTAVSAVLRRLSSRSYFFSRSISLALCVLMLGACSSLRPVDSTKLPVGMPDNIASSTKARSNKPTPKENLLPALAATTPLADGYNIDAINLPLQVLLYSLAEEAGLDLKLDAELGQSVTLRAVDKPLEQILEMLAHQSGIRWQIRDGLMNIESIEPFLKSYPVDYLNISRTAVSQVGLATQVGSINLAADAGSSASSFSNSSQSVIENQSNHQFWESLNENIELILSAGHDPQGTFMINRDTGVVTVRGTARQQDEIQRYLRRVQDIAQRQVLIEATVVEVALSDQYQAGIDWRLLASDETGLNAAQVFHGQGLADSDSINKLPAPSGLLSAIHQSNTVGRITATLQLLEGFGDVRILSRPQIIAINNQSAILKVVDNRVYFTMNVERQSREGEDDVTTSTQIHTVPVGLVMNVTPYIGADNTVILNVRPTISRILGFVNDPNPELAEAQVQNGVPEIQVREMESVLKVPDGEIVMIGGLMQQQRNSQAYSIPLLGSLPGLGRLFQNQSRRGRKTELLVFLQPTVLDSELDPELDSELDSEQEPALASTVGGTP